MSSIHAAVEVLCDYRLAVVTGGTSGIGKTFITAIAEASPHVRVCNLSRSFPASSGVQHFECDFAAASARGRVFPQVAAWAASASEPGKLLLINNSGFGTYGAFPEPKVDAHLEMIAVNVAALVELTAALLPELRRRGGAVINVASTTALQPTPQMQTYGATKTFVLNWSVALARELRNCGVRVQALCPGPTRTQFQQRAGIADASAQQRFALQPEAVVATSFRALRRGRVVVVPGWSNQLLALASHVAPRMFAARVAEGVVSRYRMKTRG